MGQRVAAFADELARYGPDAARAVDPVAARAYTWKLATTHYENFPVVTRLLPQRLRQHFANVYAYCRWADDLADEVPDAAQSLTLLDWWQSQLNECFVGRTCHPVYVALAETIQRFAIPKQPFSDLLVAFRRDRVQTRYAHFADLRSYCRGSADPVGRIVLYLAESYDDENAILSDYVCTGLQLVNFWQDVGRDVALGRIYLPAEERDRFGVLEADILAQRLTPALKALLAFEVDRAREFLEIGMPLARRLPLRLRVPIALFAEGGLTICRKLDRVGYNVFEARPRLGKWDGPGLLLRAWFRPWIENLLKD